MGRDPSDWKPIKSVGPGVREIRVSVVTNAFRTIYDARVADAIHVLHPFQKKMQQTAKRDLDLAAARLKQI